MIFLPKPVSNSRTLDMSQSIYVKCPTCDKRYHTSTELCPYCRPVSSSLLTHSLSDVDRKMNDFKETLDKMAPELERIKKRLAEACRPRDSKNPIDTSSSKHPSGQL
uniref:Histidine--tRNA ligase n=1 Tax=Lygus hesperus TaxID=30085 RepID=A0A0A9XUS4_LYGHE